MKNAIQKSGETDRRTGYGEMSMMSEGENVMKIVRCGYCKERDIQSVKGPSADIKS